MTERQKESMAEIQKESMTEMQKESMAKKCSCPKVHASQKKQGIKNSSKFERDTERERERERERGWCFTIFDHDQMKYRLIALQQVFSCSVFVLRIWIFNKN